MGLRIDIKDDARVLTLAAFEALFFIPTSTRHLSMSAAVIMVFRHPVFKNSSRSRYEISPFCISG